jgi:hypothetical protein
MLLTKEEYRAAVDLLPKLRAMQLAAKSAEQPRFPISGPMSLTVRKRRSVRPGRAMIGGAKVAGSSTENMEMSFIGGEQFALSDVFQHQMLAEGKVEIRLTFTPRGDASTLAEVTSMTMPLAQAVDVFTGLETWITDLKHVEPEKPKSKAEVLEAAREENEEYGAW